MNNCFDIDRQLSEKPNLNFHIGEISLIFETFSPSGKLVQIEYALAAVAAGGPSVGIKGENIARQK